MVDFSYGYSCYSCSCSCCSCSDRWETKSRLEFDNKMCFCHNTTQPNRDSAEFEVIVTLHHLPPTFGLGKSKRPNKTWTLNFQRPKIRFIEGYETAYNFHGC